MEPEQESLWVPTRHRKKMIFLSSSNHLVLLLLNDLISTLFSCLLSIPWIFRVNLLFLLLLLDPSLPSGVHSFSPRCKCIDFVETYGKEYGVFTSPNWPDPYEENIDCLLYHFKGNGDQVVEVTFDEFDVQKANE